MRIPQYGNCARPTATTVVRSAYCPPETLLIAVLNASFAEKNRAPEYGVNGTHHGSDTKKCLSDGNHATTIMRATVVIRASTATIGQLFYTKSPSPKYVNHVQTRPEQCTWPGRAASTQRRRTHNLLHVFKYLLQHNICVIASFLRLCSPDGSPAKRGGRTPSYRPRNSSGEVPPRGSCSRVCTEPNAMNGKAAEEESSAL